MSSPFADYAGMQFGRLTVCWPVGRAVNGKVVWLCSCQCGGMRNVDISSLTTGHTVSCGCFRKEVTGAKLRSHGHCLGHRSSPEYKAWQDAKDRCTNRNRWDFKHYGGRGIEFKFKSFLEFFACLGPKPEQTLSLDRINNDGHYEPGNVRWATKLEQSANRRPRISSKISNLKVRTP